MIAKKIFEYLLSRFSYICMWVVWFLMFFWMIFLLDGGTWSYQDGFLSLTERLLETLWSTEVYAQEASSIDASSGSKATDREIWTANSLQNIVRIIYLLMRPLLAIAWAALDNSLVYGEAFFLNISLWKMRQIMRNFANFALWGVFLFSLLYNISTWWTWDSWSRWLKTILPKLVLAWILIQASRFWMKWLIDLSTVALYAVGGLPLNILKADLEDQKNSDTNNLKYLHFLEPQVQFSFDNNDAKVWTDWTLSVFYTCQNATRDEHKFKYFVPCRIEGNAFVPYGEVGVNDTRSDRKHTEAAKRANHGRDDDKTNGETRVTTEAVVSMISDEYCIRWNKLMLMKHEDIPLAPTWENTIFWKDIDDCSIQNLLTRAHTTKKYGTGDKWGAMAAFNCPTLYSVIDKAAWMTWPLYALYASLLNMSELALTPNHKWVIEISLEFLIKTLTAVALIIPLLTLAIVLVMRAVVLRWFIIFSPLLVIWRIFFSEKVSGASENATLQSLLSLVFMPVIAVFAIWMSLVILWLFQKPQINPQKDSASFLALDQQNDGDTCVAIPDPDGSWKIIWAERKNWCPDWKCGQTNKECYSVLGIYVLCFTDSQRQFWNWILNVMTRLIINMFWIWLMWTVVFAALKTSNITRSVVSWIQDVSTQLMKALPIVPTPVWFTSVWALWSAANQVANMPQQMINNQANEINDFIDNMKWWNSEWAKDVNKRLGEISSWAAPWSEFTYKNIAAAESDSLLNDTAFAKAWWKISGESYSNVLDMLWTRKWYETLKKYGEWNMKNTQDAIIKKAWSAWLQEKVTYGNSLFDTYSWKKKNLWFKAYSSNDPNRLWYFYDTTSGHQEVIRMSRSGPNTSWNVTHLPLDIDTNDVAKTREHLNGVFGMLNGDDRDQIISDLWLESNSVFKAVYDQRKKYMAMDKTSDEFKNISDTNPKLDININDIAYEITYENNSFSKISKFWLKEET